MVKGCHIEIKATLFSAGTTIKTGSTEIQIVA